MFGLKAKRFRGALILLSIFLMTSLFVDLYNVLRLLIRCIWGMQRGEVFYFTFAARLAWTFYITQFQAIPACLEYFYTKKLKLRLSIILHLLFNVAITSGFLYLAFFKYGVPSRNPATLKLALLLIKGISWYLPILYLHSIYLIYKRFNAVDVPKILSYQSWYLSGFVISIYILEMFMTSMPIVISTFPVIEAYENFISTLGTIATTVTLLFVARKMVGLRFLNLRKTVESKEKFNFLSQFRDILEQLSYATALKELAQHTQRFFHTAFQIPIGRVRLYVRKADTDTDEHSYYDIVNTTAKVEHYIGKHENQNITKALRDMKLFIRDDIHFSHFYEEDESSKEILQFLDHITYFTLKNLSLFASKPPANKENLKFEKFHVHG